jgi:hypothetical protein
LNPKGLSVRVGDVITYVGDVSVPDTARDPLRLVKDLVRSKRAQVRDIEPNSVRS